MVNEFIQETDFCLFPELSLLRICLQCRRPWFDPWARKTPWRRKWQPTVVFLPEKSQGQRNLAGYSPWGHKHLRHDLATKPPPPLRMLLNVLLLCTAKKSLPKNVSSAEAVQLDLVEKMNLHCSSQCYFIQFLFLFLMSGQK